MRAEELSYGYEKGAPVISGLSFAVPPEKSTAIVGPNGSGKSTLLRLICGLLTPQSGQVWLKGQPVETMSIPQRARRVAILFQNPDDQIFKGRVADELRYAPLLAGMNPDLLESHMMDVVEICDIKGTLDRNPYDLSRAQRKRVCLASVLLMETPIVLLDEPMSGQDAAGRMAVMGAMDALRAQGASVVAVTHDMNFAARFDRVVALEGGHLKAEGTPRELFTHEEYGLPLPDAVALGRKLRIPGVCLTEAEVLEGLSQLRIESHHP